MPSRPHPSAAVPLALSFAFALAGLATPAVAVEPLDTFNLRAGGYVARFDTQVRANGTVTAGTDIDLERDLGLGDDTTLAFVGADWRPFERHEFGLGYYRDSADARKRLEREIVFEDTVYPVAATVAAQYAFDAYEFNYTWWAAANERWALGPRLGLVWYDIELRVDLELDAEGNQAAVAGTEQASADLPALSAGFNWRWTPAQDWRISATAGYFSTRINDIDADVAYGRIGAEWYPWERFGFWLDYTRNDIEATVERSQLRGRVDFADSGVRAGVAYCF